MLYSEVTPLDCLFALAFSWSRRITALTVFFSCLVLLIVISRRLSMLSRDQTENGGSKITFDPKDQGIVKQKLDAREVKISRLFVHPIKSCRGISVLTSRYTQLGLEYDRQWCIIDAQSHAIITAREFPKMVLITTRIVENSIDRCGGQLEITFPKESGCEAFSVPLKPNPETLERWSTVEDCTVFIFAEIDGYITQPHSSSRFVDSSLCSATLSRFFGKPVHLIYKGPRLRPAPPTWSFPNLKVGINYQDVYPIMVVSKESFLCAKAMVASWCREQEREELRNWDTDSLVLERYRPNVVFEGASLPFAEDMWRKMTISSPTPHGLSNVRSFTLVSKCTRCLLPNIDPATGTRNLNIPSKPLLKFRKDLDPGRLGYSCFGCNAVPAEAGSLTVGDVVSVQTWGFV